MAPSTPKPKPVAKPLSDTPPITRMRAVKTGHNEYTLLRETWTSPPDATETVVTKVDGVSAQYRCRLHLEEQLGPNRLGGTGL
jgi:hypothetical protein